MFSSLTCNIINVLTPFEVVCDRIPKCFAKKRSLRLNYAESNHGGCFVTLTGPVSRIYAELVPKGSIRSAISPLRKALFHRYYNCQIMSDIHIVPNISCKRTELRGTPIFKQHSVFSQMNVTLTVANARATRYKSLKGL